MDEEWARIVGIVVSVNVLTGFVASLYAAIIAFGGARRRGRTAVSDGHAHSSSPSPMIGGRGDSGRVAAHGQRTDTASRVIRSVGSRRSTRRMLDPQAVAAVAAAAGHARGDLQFRCARGRRLPHGVRLRGRDRRAGKTSANADVFEGQFVELVPGERIVERVEFRSDDPAFAGAMTITTTLRCRRRGHRGSISFARTSPRASAPPITRWAWPRRSPNLAAFVE